MTFPKDSVLNAEVSCFKNYDTATNPKSIHLLQWLYSPKYRQQVERIRLIDDKTERDALKAELPAITPSGLFSYRAGSKLIKHSGLIQFDIDLKENKHIRNYAELKGQLCRLQNVAYCGLSVSGKGYWGLIPISNPARHKEHFNALKEDFARWGIMLDSMPQNVASLRGYSFDSNGYFNHYATLYKRMKAAPKPKPKPKKTQRKRAEKQTVQVVSASAREKVEQLVSTISHQRIDLTDSYQRWFEIGCSLACEFGEGGREYFHTISQFNSGYCPTKTDKQFNGCLKCHRFSISTFIHYCKRSGITYEYKQPEPEPITNSLPKGFRYEEGILKDTGEKVVNLINEMNYPASWDV